MKYRNALTLIELLGTLIILLVLVTIVAPWIQSQHKMTHFSNHLQQIALACQAYKDTYGSYPPAFVTDTEGKPLYSWRVLILPFLERKNRIAINRSEPKT
ncbi:MAG: DUF1559 domain-containing protein [Planctomycetaceae bacterium]|jgi:type II secretory pathway pseudopilin PulG|nr:DUF1559 domain-containing protein [Planctomycetaceae bacterium]